MLRVTDAGTLVAAIMKGNAAVVGMLIAQGAGGSTRRYLPF